MRLAFGLVLVAAASGLAHADPAAPITLRVSEPVELPITIGALGLAVVPIAIPQRAHKPWEHELIDGLDLDVRDNFAPHLARVSDATIGLTIAAPVFYLSSTSLTDPQADRLGVYAETMAIDLALVQIAKYVVQRPRPYTYNQSAAARAYAKRHPDDAYLSFYSSHAALGFGAAVAGAYLFAAGHDNQGERAFVWGTGLASATFTANLRVRSGMHFYSDILIGAAVGTAIGYAVPAMHSDTAYTPSAADLAIGALGILTGAIASELIPAGGVDAEGREPRHAFQVGPMPIAHGGGLALSFSR